MSRNRRKKSQSVEQVADKPVEAPQHAPEPPPTRFAIGVAVSVWGSWLLALIALAMFSANPVSINRVQIARSTVVAVGKVLDPVAGKVSVSQALSGEMDAGEIVVTNLDQVAEVQQGRDYVFPLRFKDGSLMVVVLPSSKSGPVIYPATAEVKQELETIFQEILDQPLPRVPVRKPR